MSVAPEQPSLWSKITGSISSAANTVARKAKELTDTTTTPALNDGPLVGALRLPSEGAGRTVTGGRRHRTRRHRAKKHRKTGKRKH